MPPGPSPPVAGYPLPSAEVASLVERLHHRGFDALALGAVQDYNAAVPAEYRLPDLGRARTLVLVVGNSRDLWPRFEEALRADPARARRGDPFDTWVTEEVGAALEALPLAHATRFAHEPPPRRVGMVKLAVAAGLAHLGPAHLALRPGDGPWFALRAAVVLDVEAPASPPEAAPDPCAPCTRPCVPALEAALAGPEPAAFRRVPSKVLRTFSDLRGCAPRTGPDGDLEETWRSWLAVRDACPEGRERRYGEVQLRYHYTKDPALLV